MELNINIRLTADKGLTDTLMSLTSTLAALLENRPVVSPTPVPVEIEPLPSDNPKDTKETKESVADNPVEAKEEYTGISEKEIRAAMETVRRRCEYPGGAEDPDPVIHKALTRIFKDLAERIDKGTKPTKLTGVYAQEFIKACEGISMINGKPCPFKEEEGE